MTLSGFLSALLRSGSEPSYRPLEDGRTIVAIGDIHGCNDELRRLHAALDACWPLSVRDSVTEIYLGDYIDRGPDSAGVLGALTARRETHDCVFLRGNHEEFVSSILEGSDAVAEWLQYGGEATLRSYGLERTGLDDARIADLLRRNMPAEHQAFIRNLPYVHEEADYIFVHAGMRPKVRPEWQAPKDMLWIRDEFLTSRFDFGKVIVHGHTPVDAVDMRRNRINVDTGAYRSGILSAVVIDADGARVLA